MYPLPLLLLYDDHIPPREWPGVTARGAVTVAHTRAQCPSRK